MIDLSNSIDLSAYNDKGKKEIMKFFFSHPKIYERIINKGAVQELEKILKLEFYDGKEIPFSFVKKSILNRLKELKA